jgi:sulfur-oxidizing protein SoxZ
VSRPRIRIPSRARAGEVIEIRTLIDHPMVTGVSSPAPRDMLATLVVRQDGEVILEADFGNGTSANPYLVLFARVDRTSEFELVWTHENGERFRATATVEVA